MDNIRYYAGIGSRETPDHIITMMQSFAEELSNRGFHVRSGHSGKADMAFENGSCVSKQEIWVPWVGFNDAIYDKPTNLKISLGHPNEAQFEAIAKKHHGNWGVCNPAAKKLLTRNVPVVLGENLKTHAEFLISYTPGGQGVGGTNHTNSIAQSYGIPVFNLGGPSGLTDLLAFAKTL